MIPLLLAALLSAPAAAAATAAAPAQTLKDWVFIDAGGDKTYAVPKDEYDKALAQAQSGAPGTYATANAYALSFDKDSPDLGLRAHARLADWTLKIYPKGPAGIPEAFCPLGKLCSGDKVPAALRAAEIPARPCAAGACPRLTIDRPALKRDGTALTPADAARPLTVSLPDGRPVIGSELSLFKQLTPARRTALLSLRAADPKAYDTVVSFWTAGTPPNAALDARLQAYLKDPNIAYKTAGEDMTVKPDVMSSLDPLELAYIRQLPPQTRDALLAEAKDLKNPADAVKFLKGVKGMVREGLSPKAASAQDQAKALAAHLKGLMAGQVPPEKMTAALSAFDGSKAAGALPGSPGVKADAVVVPGGPAPKKPDLVNAPPGAGLLGQGQDAPPPDLAPGQDGGSSPSLLSKVGAYLKDPRIGGAVGILAGAGLGFAMGGPFGAVVGGLAGLLIGPKLFGLLK